MCWPLQIFSVVPVPDDFRDIVHKANSIHEVELDKAEIIKQNGKLCGIQYTSSVKRSLKGNASPKTLSFVASESLSVAENYVIILSKDNLNFDKAAYSRSG